LRQEDPEAAMPAPAAVILAEGVPLRSSRRNTGLKVEGYFNVPTIAHYLVVDLAKRILLHCRRQNDARIDLPILRSGTFTLDPPGISVELALFFG
jgi:hypothetical protein